MHLYIFLALFKGLMSAYALALFTNRQFLINITVPCNFSQLFIPNKVNWLANDYGLYSNMSKRKIVCKNRKNISVSDCIESFNAIVNNSFKEDIIKVTTNYNFINEFAIIFKENIQSLGYSAEGFRLDKLFHKWYHDLFNLEPTLENKYNLILKQANLNAYENKPQIFCAQIRIGGTSEHVQGDLQFNNRNVSKLFWDYIRKKFIKRATRLNQEWKLFVTSDREDVEIEAIEEFGSHKVIRIEGLNTHVGHEAKLGNNCSRIEKPILDFHFLQNCDKAVITNGSYFGLIGLYNRKKGLKDIHFIGLKPNKKLWNPYFKKNKTTKH